MEVDVDKYPQVEKPTLTKSKINDLDLKNWKEYADVLTGSLWLMGERDKSGAHKGDYHGNFIPQIPNQFLRIK